MKKKPIKKKYELVHKFYEQLHKLLDSLEKQTGRRLEVQINIKK